MKTAREKTSYCIGLEVGSNLKRQFTDMDLPQLIQGFQDALNNKAPQMEEEEIHETMASLKSQMEMQQKQFITKIAEENKEHGEKFLRENKKREGIVALSSGLQYEVLEKGIGKYSPTSFDTVAIRYKGSFIDGQVFDSTEQKAQSFPVNRIIPGWAEVVKLMKIKDKWRVFIPSYLAYGETGLAPLIEPNKTLIFEIELLSINEQEDI